MFKGQDSCVCLETMSSGAEVIVDGPGALPLLLCCRSMVAKEIQQRFRSSSYIHFRTNDEVDEAGTFTGEGIREVEGLMYSARMDDIVGK